MSRETSVELEILEAGYCTHPKAIVLPGSSFAPMRFPANVALIRHPREGVILFDTGYSTRFHALTQRLPEKLYALVTPVSIETGQDAKDLLALRGIQTSDVRHVVLSHFHADHVGGAIDFPKAQIHADLEAFKRIHAMPKLRQVLSGYLAGLFPETIEPRIRTFTSNRKVPTGLIPFPEGYDLFGDESAIAVELPGHSLGHWGLLLRRSDGTRAFLLGDAAWTHESYREKRYPSSITRLLFSDSSEYHHTIDRIHDVWKADSKIELLPCHCEISGKIKSERGSP